MPPYDLRVPGSFGFAGDFEKDAPVTIRGLYARGRVQTAGELLQKGNYPQVMAGDLDGAIGICRQIVGSGKRAARYRGFGDCEPGGESP